MVASTMEMVYGNDFLVMEMFASIMEMVASIRKGFVQSWERLGLTMEMVV